MAFNPDAYLAKTANSGLPPVAVADKSQGFDPDSYLAKTKQSSQESPTARDNSSQAALEGMGSELTFGYLPQLQSLAEPLTSKIGDLLTGGDVSKDLGSYTERRDENIQRNQELEKGNPYAYGSGRVGGGVVSSIIPGGIVGKGAKATGLLGRLGAAGAAGATRGLVMNPGDTKGEISGPQIEERLSNAKEQGILGTLFQGGGEGLGLIAKGAGKSVNALKGFAEDRAFKAGGPMLREVKQANTRYGTKEYGRVMLDNKLLHGDSSYGAIAEKASKVKGEVGKRIGETVDKLDEAAKFYNQNHPDFVVDPSGGMVPNGAKIAEKLGVKTFKVSDDLRKNLSNLEEIPGGDRLNAQLRKFVSQWEKGKKPILGFKEAEELKKGVGKRINWDRLPNADVPLEEQRLRVLYSSLREGVEEGLDEAAERAGSAYGKEIQGAFKKDKKTYGIMSDVEQMASKQEERQLARNFLSPGDMASTGTGAILGSMSGEGGIEGGLKGAATGLLLNRGRRFIADPKGAIVMDKVAGLLGKNPVPLLNNRVMRGAGNNPVAAGLLGGGLLGDKANQKKKK